MNSAIVIQFTLISKTFANFNEKSCDFPDPLPPLSSQFFKTLSAYLLWIIIKDLQLWYLFHHWELFRNIEYSGSFQSVCNNEPKTIYNFNINKIDKVGSKWINWTISISIESISIKTVKTITNPSIPQFLPPFFLGSLVSNYFDLVTIVISTSFKPQPVFTFLLCRYVHTADVLRLLLIYKFGGFHLDTDFVILKPLVGLTNVVASDTAEGTFRHQCGAFRLVEILEMLWSHWLNLTATKFYAITTYRKPQNVQWGQFSCLELCLYGIGELASATCESQTWSRVLRVITSPSCSAEVMKENHFTNEWLTYWLSYWRSDWRSDWRT